MRMVDLFNPTVIQAMQLRVCSRNDCPFKGQPQPITEFYKGRRDCRTCRKRLNAGNVSRGYRNRKNSPHAVVREGSRRLPIEPWRNWLLERMDAEGKEQLAFSLGVSDRIIWRWIHESEHADLDAIDRALCHRWTPWVLRELYPEIYDFEDAA